MNLFTFFFSDTIVQNTHDQKGAHQTFKGDEHRGGKTGIYI